MSVFYRLRKNNNSKSAQYGKYYARAVHVSTLTTNDIANIIQRNCSVKRSDVKAVIEEEMVDMTGIYGIKLVDLKMHFSQ